MNMRMTRTHLKNELATKEHKKHKGKTLKDFVFSAPFAFLASSYVVFHRFSIVLCSCIDDRSGRQVRVQVRRE